MKKIYRHLLLSLSLFLFFIGGVSLYYTWGPTDRMPAAVPAFSSDDIGLDKADQVLKQANINLEAEVYTVSFPHLKSVCSEYDRFTFTFTTPNVKVSGATPSMTISGKCSDLASNYVLQIPFQKIMQEEPGDIDLNMPEVANLSFQFRDVIGFWPEYWVLSRVSFQQQASGQSLVFDERSVAYATDNKISMRWRR